MGYVKWYGHAAFEFEIDGVKGLIDPWITNPLSPVKVDDIKGVELILVTHDHGDHLGETVDIASKNNATVVSIYELSLDLEGKGVKAIGMNIGGYFEFKGLKVFMVPAFHSSSKGSPIGFVIEGHETTLYHAGDTGVFYDMKLIGEMYKPKIALLPIGGLFTMDPNAALKAVELIKPKVVIPMHYNTFPQIRQDPEKFREAVKEKYPEVKVVILKPGEEYRF